MSDTLIEELWYLANRVAQQQAHRFRDQKELPIAVASAMLLAICWTKGQVYRHKTSEHELAKQMSELFVSYLQEQLQQGKLHPADVRGFRDQLESCLLLYSEKLRA